VDCVGVTSHMSECGCGRRNLKGEAAAQQTKPTRTTVRLAPAISHVKCAALSRGCLCGVGGGETGIVALRHIPSFCNLLSPADQGRSKACGGKQKRALRAGQDE